MKRAVCSEEMSSYFQVEALTVEEIEEEPANGDVADLKDDGSPGFREERRDALKEKAACVVEVDDALGHALTPPRRICRAGVERCLASWRGRRVARHSCDLAWNQTGLSALPITPRR